MSYIVLARKYRSQTFDDVIGQEPIAQTLKNAIKTARIAHAFLFVGTRGVGKTTMARILAKALNCQSSDKPTTDPCCKCESCIAVNTGEDIDVIEIDGASNNGVDQVRELRENAIYKPARARFKIYIIDEVHMLTVAAFNALLKILEEPPPHVKFIFATTEPNKVIPTIQSRCQRFDFRNISAAGIAGHLKEILKQEKIKADEDLILAVAKMANGSMRDSLSLLDRLISVGIEPLTLQMLEDFLGCANIEKVYNLASAIAETDAAAALKAVDELSNSGQNEVQIADSLVDYFRDIMVIKSAGQSSELVIMTEDQRQKAQKLADKFDIAGLVYNITMIEKSRWAIKNSDQSRALLEAIILRITLSEHFINVDSLLDGSRAVESPDLKKNEIISPRPAIQHIPQAKIEPPVVGELFTEGSDIGVIKKHWPKFLDLVTHKLGKGTSALLMAGSPAGFENGILTINFGSGGEATKKIIESNGKKEQIEALLSDNLKKRVEIKLEVQAPAQQTNSEDKKKGITEKHNEILSDPSIKDILLEFGATVTGIEENPA